MKRLQCSKQWLSGLIVILGLITVSISSAEVVNPEAIIAAESKKLLSILEKESANFNSNPQSLYAQVTTQLKGMANIPAIARGIMGSYYKAATAEQQKRFAVVFEQSLVKIYSDSLMKAQPKSETVIPATTASATARKRKVSVSIAVQSGSVYQVSYSMLLNKQDQWKVRNIVVDGVNFGLTYRNQFKSEMQQSGDNMDSVINNWAKSAK